MRSTLVVVGNAGLKDPAQVRSTDDHDVVEAFASNRPDQPFRIRVLPGRPRRGRVVADVHRAHTLHERRAVDRVAITNEVARGAIPGKGLGDLTRDRVCTENYIRAY